mmetsp:Transcript_113611/g.321708  ORF Transcript_113611/g.321708 Transcript_113611/m.321708 type:complete len:359 (-) Transcript_113611:189-1265(-)
MSADARRIPPGRSAPGQRAAGGRPLRVEVVDLDRHEVAAGGVLPDDEHVAVQVRHVEVPRGLGRIDAGKVLQPDAWEVDAERRQEVGLRAENFDGVQLDRLEAEADAVRAVRPQRRPRLDLGPHQRGGERERQQRLRPRDEVDDVGRDRRIYDLVYRAWRCDRICCEVQDVEGRRPNHSPGPCQGSRLVPLDAARRVDARGVEYLELADDVIDLPPGAGGGSEAPVVGRAELEELEFQRGTILLEAQGVGRVHVGGGTEINSVIGVPGSVRGKIVNRRGPLVTGGVPGGLGRRLVAGGFLPARVVVRARLHVDAVVARQRQGPGQRLGRVRAVRQPRPAQGHGRLADALRHCASGAPR